MTGVKGQFRTIHGTRRSVAITVRASTGPYSERGKSDPTFTLRCIYVYIDIILLLKSRISTSLHNVLVKPQYFPKTLRYIKYRYVALGLFQKHISHCRHVESIDSSRMQHNIGTSNAVMLTGCHEISKFPNCKSDVSN
jgi:hypothetical protein